MLTKDQIMDKYCAKTVENADKQRAALLAAWLVLDGCPIDEPGTPEEQAEKILKDAGVT